MAGAVTSASVMVNLPAFGHAMRLAADAPGLGTGLHFNILAGRPLTPALSLVRPRSGDFLSYPALVRRAFAGRIRSADVYAECAAQIARLRDAGRTVTHLDSHRHVHVLPTVWAAVRRAADDAGIAHVRVPLRPAGGAPRGFVAAVKQSLLGAWYRAAGGARTPASVRFEGIALMGGDGFARGLVPLLAALPTGVTELMVHPGYDDAELAAIDSYRSAREIELRALISPPVLEALRDVELTHFGRL